MGLGGATKKLQKVADMGEELYARMNELREQIVEVRETVQDTHERVAALENKVDQQAALLEAIAESEGIDVDELLTEVAIEEAEPAITDAEGDDPAAVPDAEDGDRGDTGTGSGE
ncbi:DUF5798 family protein [Natronomonas gomsonensis]|uniref:DUF5798 family protein n=1 Tax=Natronomonas gomsonensis TaxID=1046043 RepID=UPI0015B93C50|nr:DUF5798 family protein [Natronomonas gomsonensis]